jgi:LacI family transcriptional regulator
VGSEPATLQSIADALDVSKSTVQQALNGAGNLSPERRRQVRELAESLGYRPNAVARALSTGRTGQIGAIVPSLGNEWDAELAEGIEGAMRHVDRCLLLGCCHNDDQRRQQLLQKFLDNRVDGLLVVPPQDPEPPETFPRLREVGVPTVFLARRPTDPRADCVLPDHHAGGYLAGAHLARLGRRRIAYLHHPGLDYQTRPERGEGCAQALHDYGLGDLLRIPLCPCEDGGWVTSGYRSVRRFLESGEPIDGLFVFNDLLAAEALSAIRDCGLRVPQDLAVVGFNDERAAAFYDPPLTSVNPRLGEVGALAVRLLLQRLEGDESPSRPSRLTVEPSLTVRRSCGAVSQ